jgi:RimJ/RimL family protein N-acetyltransferase
MLTLPHSSLDIPLLDTERLRLRGHRVEDFPAYAAMWADERVTRYTTSHSLSEEDIWARFLRGAGHWAMLGFGYWAVEEKATGSFVGELGFGDFKRDLQPSFRGLPEMGWIFSPAVHGKGYAAEAVRVALAWGNQRFAPTRPVCLIAPENEPSIRLAEKTGFREFGRATYKGGPAVLFRYTEV